MKLLNRLAGFKTIFRHLMCFPLLPRLPNKLPKFSRLSEFLQQLRLQPERCRKQALIKNFSLKQRNDDIRTLQTFLKSQGVDIYPEGLVTGYFGPLTEEAAGRFQLKYGLVQDKDDPAYG